MFSYKAKSSSFRVSLFYINKTNSVLFPVNKNQSTHATRFTASPSALNSSSFNRAYPNKASYISLADRLQNFVYYYNKNTPGHSQPSSSNSDALARFLRPVFIVGPYLSGMENIII